MALTALPLFLMIPAAAVVLIIAVVLFHHLRS